MMFIYAAVVALWFQTTETPNPNIWIDNNEVWMQTAGGPRQLTSDNIPKRLPLLSPDSKRLIYVVDRFERLDWIDERRIGAMVCGHANCFYWIMNPDTGETIQVMVDGFDFVWSHDRHWVARKLVGDTPVGEFETLKLNEADIYPPGNDPDVVGMGFGRQPEHAHNLGPFTWSPHDAWLGFMDSQPADDVYVVLASTSGVILREKLAMPVRYDTAVEWTDDAHFQLKIANRMLRFVINGSEVQQLPQ